MICQLSRDLETNLRARKFPVEISYGPERLQRGACESYAIQVRRDDEAGDGVATTQGAASNPKKWGQRNLGTVATFYVQSPVSGSTIADHERDCDSLVDAFIIELIAWGVGGRAGVVDFAESRYLSAAEFHGAEHFNGVVYRLRFEVPRAILEKDYEGAARATGAPLSVSTESFARVDGGTREEI